MIYKEPKVIAPDDLEVGLCCTVHESILIETDRTVVRDMDGSILQTIATIHSNSAMVGEPLELLSINLPFVAAKVLFNQRPVILDVRCMKIIPLKEDFVRAVGLIP